MANVTGLYIYPIKSCRGISLQKSPCDASGLRFDREWVVRATSGKALTQRDVPHMALVTAEPADDSLTLSYEGRAPLVVSSAGHRERMITDVWGTETAGLDEGDEAAAWLSEVVGADVRLVRRDFAEPRLSHLPMPNGERAPLSYFDAMPLLVVSEESLTDLNEHIGGESISMDRFRASIVVRGLGAFAEDDTKAMRIGGITLHRANGCARCVITTIDQDTAAPRGPEPLRTLKTYRKKNEKVYFGMYFMPEGNGTIAVGDDVVVSE